MGSYAPGYTGPTMNGLVNGQPDWDITTRATYPPSVLNAFGAYMQQPGSDGRWSTFQQLYRPQGAGGAPGGQAPSGGGGGNPYSGQRFIPASHVGQYQVMGGGQGSGLGTSWGGGGGLGGGGMASLNPPKPSMQQPTPNPPMVYGSQQGGGQIPQLASGQSYGPGGWPLIDLARTNPQQSGIIDWISQARAGDPSAQYNLINSYGWNQAAGGNLGGAIDWLTRQGIDPKQAAVMAGWVQQNPNTWGGVNQASLNTATRNAFDLTNANLVAAGQPARQWDPNTIVNNPATTQYGPGAGVPGMWMGGGGQMPQLGGGGQAPLNPQYGNFGPVTPFQHSPLTSLLSNQTFGPLAQGVLRGTLQPQAAVKQAQALGAGNEQIAQWAKLLGY